MTAKLQALKKKHAFLEYELAKETSFSHKDDSRISDLKKKKLKIKDTIERLSRMRSVRRLRRSRKAASLRSSYVF